MKQIIIKTLSLFHKSKNNVCKKYFFILYNSDKDINIKLIINN